MTERFGTVYLVGSGPGDPDLLTVRAHRHIREADVLLYDSLVGEEIVDQVPGPETELVDVGKRPDEGRRWKQSEINRCMVTKAREAEAVVRLKGGDPTVFGRGGEEAEYLAERDVPFEFVPGITSAIAGAELTGIPLTHREHASSLTVVTGHEDPTKPESALDWESLAGNVEAGGTLVILMGVSKMNRNLAMLQEHGVDADTPVAVVENVARPDGSSTFGTVETMPRRCEQAGVEPPAVVIVGDVVSVREEIENAILETMPQLSDDRGQQRVVAAGVSGADATGQNNQRQYVVEAVESRRRGTGNAPISTVFHSDRPEP